MSETRPEFKEAIHKTILETWRPRCAGRPAPPTIPALCSLVSVMYHQCDQCPLMVKHGISEIGQCIPQYQTWLEKVEQPGNSEADAKPEAIKMLMALAKLLPYKERRGYESWGKFK